MDDMDSGKPQNGNHWLSDSLCNPLSMSLVKQNLFLDGVDANNSHAIYGQDVAVVASKASGSTQPPIASSKVKINPVVNFDWEHKYYIGNLVAIHLNQIHIAYILKGKSGGIVRVTNRKTAERTLLKNFCGQVIDISFAFTSRIILGVVDEPGNMYIYEITENLSGKIEERLMLQVDQPTGLSPSEYHRVIWCSYLPEDDPGSNTSAADVVDDALLLMLSHNEVAEVWHVDMVYKELGTGPHLSTDIVNGLFVINSHSKPIVDAVFSPDATAIATASYDGYVKFFQLDMNDPSTPKCIHQWQPHDGQPLSCLFFLDDHKHPQTETQFWKFAVTGSNFNRELKVWSCKSWTCHQTITFSSHPDDSDKTQLEPSLKASLDLSSTYLVLSDISRQVLYILQLYQESETNRAHVCSFTEFLLMQPCLSFSVLDARCKKLLDTEEHNSEHAWSCTTGEIGREEEDEDVTPNFKLHDILVLIRLYSIHSRAMQELQIRYQPQTSIHNCIPESISSASELDSGMRDMLSDVSIDKSVDHIGEAPSLHQLTSPSGGHLLSGDASLHQLTSPSGGHLLSGDASLHQLTSPSASLHNSLNNPMQQPLLLTPDAFTSPRRPENSTAHGTDLTASSISSSLTLVTGLNEDDLRLFSSSNAFSAHQDSMIATGLSAEHSFVQPDEEDETLVQSNSFRTDNVANLLVSASNDSFPIIPSMSDLAAEEVGSNAEKQEIDDFFNRVDADVQDDDGSSDSGSSASQEVTQIFENQENTDFTPEIDMFLKGNDEEEEQEEENVTEDEEPEQQQLNLEHLEKQQSWPQAAGVINVDDMIQKTEAAWKSQKDFHKSRIVEEFENTPSFELNRMEGDQDLTTRHGQISSNELAAFTSETKELMQEIFEMMRQQKEQIEMLQSSVQKQHQLEDIVERLHQQVASLSDGLDVKVSQVVSQQAQFHSHQLEKALQDLNVRNDRRYEELTLTLSRAVDQSVGSHLDQTVSSHVQRNLIPKIEQCLEPVKDILHTELAQRLSSTDSVIKSTITKLIKSKATMEPMSQAATEEMCNSLQAVNQNVIIPSIDRSCQNMMQQLAAMFMQGSQQYLQNMESNINQTRQMIEAAKQPAVQQLKSMAESLHKNDNSQKQTSVQLTNLITTLQTALGQLQASQTDDADGIQSKFNQLQESLSQQVKQIVAEELAVLLQEQQVAINEQLNMALRSGAATPAPSIDIHQIQFQISTLLQQGKFNNAFQLALSATDLSLVEFACETIDPSLVFGSDSCALEQSVLLSLIQQLSADLHSKTELKHRFLEDAILYLDQSDSVTKEYLPAVVGQLCKKLSDYVQNKSGDPMSRPMSKLLRTSELLVKANTQQNAHRLS